MAAKTKRGPLDTLCTNDAARRAWTFETGKLLWEYREGMGINLFLIQNGGAKPALFCKSLDHAVLFAHGFSAGLQVPRKGQEEAKG